jgi:hypothetical protein
MPGQASHDFVYVHTDVPEGMTIREWHAHLAAQLAERLPAASR